MKKFAVIALAAVMLLSTLAGCGANAEGGSLCRHGHVSK